MYQWHLLNTQNTHLLLFTPNYYLKLLKYFFLEWDHVLVFHFTYWILLLNMQCLIFHFTEWNLLLKMHCSMAYTMTNKRASLVCTHPRRIQHTEKSQAKIQCKLSLSPHFKDWLVWCITAKISLQENDFLREDSMPPGHNTWQISTLESFALTGICFCTSSWE